MNYVTKLQITVAVPVNFNESDLLYSLEERDKEFIDEQLKVHAEEKIHESVSDEISKAIYLLLKNCSAVDKTLLKENFIESLNIDIGEYLAPYSTMIKRQYDLMNGPMNHKPKHSKLNDNRTHKRR